MNELLSSAKAGDLRVVEQLVDRFIRDGTHWMDPAIEVAC
jgi:hypothetical protein